MNILYLNHYTGGPAFGMEYRPYYLSREWVRAGHRVRLVAASYSHVRSRQPQQVTAPRIDVIDGIEHQWLPTPAYQGNGLGRVKNIWAYLRQVWAMARQTVVEFKPDLIIASSTYPMDIWVAKRLRHLSGAAVVFEVHDLWPLSPIELNGMSPKHPFIRLVQWAEDVAYRDSDVVVSLLPKVHGYMASRGLDLAKLTIVPNGISPEDWATEPEPLRPDIAQTIREARAAGHVVVGYAGSMGLPNALDHLLDAAQRLAPQKLSFVLIGDGHERERLARRVHEERLRNVTLLPPVPKAMIPSFLRAIDIAYIGWQRTPIYRFGIAPNKLMDYMMAGCAVLHSVEAGNDPVAEAGCGLTAAPESPDAIAQGLLKLAAKTPDERRAMGERGHAFVMQHHTYPVLAQRFLDAVRTRVGSHRLNR
ncbi:MAG: glycosyltransferase family 4 protein [Burkholderiales bacterium]